VFEVGGEMVAPALSTRSEGTVDLACDLAWAIELRALHPAVRPGYHASTRHWNTVELAGTIDDEELSGMIRHSSELVLQGLAR
jgi:predicted DNA-binding protein (MmcQ/YjbR family)